MDYEENETTAEEDHVEMIELDNMIFRASKELKQVAEENQQLLELLDKPKHLKLEKQLSIFTSSNKNKMMDTEILMEEIDKAEQQAKNTANIIFKLKTRVAELLAKERLTNEETKELADKNDELKKHMIAFEEKTEKLQQLIEKTNIKKDENSLTKIYENNKRNESTKSTVCSSCSENIRQLSNIPTFARKLSQSYLMQEKLASENADLESVRFKLQEELLQKDQTLECFQREISNLQNELRLSTRENATLNEKLKKLQEKDTNKNFKNKPPYDTFISNKLKEYADNTYELEKELIDMENDVKFLKEEIYEIQREREHLEKHRKLMYISKPFRLPSPTPWLDQLKGLSYPVTELFDQYEKLQQDIKWKLNEVTTLRNDYDQLKNLTKEAEEFKENIENNLHEYETQMKDSPENEEQLKSVKKRFSDAQNALKEQKGLIKEQKKQLETIRVKYVEARQQLDEPKGKDIKNENNISGLGAHILTNLQEKLKGITI